MVPLVCPHCGKSANAPDEARGKRVRCPQCRGAIGVPAAHGYDIELEEVGESMERAVPTTAPVVPSTPRTDEPPPAVSVQLPPRAATTAPAPAAPVQTVRPQTAPEPEPLCYGCVAVLATLLGFLGFIVGGVVTFAGLGPDQATGATVTDAPRFLTGIAIAFNALFISTLAFLALDAAKNLQAIRESLAER